MQETAKREQTTFWYARRVLLVGTILTSMILVFSAAPADAHPNLEHHCQPGEMCNFKSGHYTNGIKRHTNGDPWYGNNSYSDCSGACNLNDSVTSIDNDGLNCNTRHYNDSWWSGTNFVLGQGNAISQLSSTYDNKGTSFKWCG